MDLNVKYGHYVRSIWVLFDLGSVHSYMTTIFIVDIN